MKLKTKINFMDFIENLKDIAGTCFLTRTEFDKNPKKICSFSYINRNFNTSWNSSLKEAGVNAKLEWVIPSNRGRKKQIKILKQVSCLKCDKLFDSFDPRLNRICKNCKNSVEFNSEWVE